VCSTSSTGGTYLIVVRAATQHSINVQLGEAEEWDVAIAGRIALGSPVACAWRAVAKWGEHSDGAQESSVDAGQLPQCMQINAHRQAPGTQDHA
jgi:hypothetical protein